MTTGLEQHKYVYRVFYKVSGNPAPVVGKQEDKSSRLPFEDFSEFDAAIEAAGDRHAILIINPNWPSSHQHNTGG